MNVEWFVEMSKPICHNAWFIKISARNVGKLMYQAYRSIGTNDIRIRFHRYKLDVPFIKRCEPSAMRSRECNLGLMQPRRKLVLMIRKDIPIYSDRGDESFAHLPFTTALNNMVFASPACSHHTLDLCLGIVCSRDDNPDTVSLAMCLFRGSWRQGTGVLEKRDLTSIDWLEGMGF